MSDVPRETPPTDADLDTHGEPLPSTRSDPSTVDGPTPLSDLVDRYGRRPTGGAAADPSSSSSSDLPTTPPPDRRGVGSEGQTEDGLEDGRRGEGRGDGATAEEEEERAAKTAPLAPENGRYPDVLYCPYCGPVAIPHICPGVSRFDVPVPEEFEELVVYLLQVWDIKHAELVALECGSAAIRWAVRTVGRGRVSGGPYTQPAGLIVKIARNLAKASRRRR